MAMAAIVAKEACLRSTSFGTTTAKFIGTETTSACYAPAPPHATKSPTLKLSTPSPTAITSPAQL